MPRGEHIDREKVLNCWGSGGSIEDVCAIAGQLRGDSVLSLISEARRAGDPRAARRPRQRAEIYRTANSVALNALKRRRKLAKLPVNPIQIMQAIAAYVGPVTVCRPGVHAGHRPTCLVEIGL